MGRAALVTAGTGSLGKAVAIALQARGHRVALVDHCDAITAHAFTQATSIPVFAWDIADVAACSKGIAAVERAIGSIDILVNYVGAGHEAQWEQTIHASLGAMFNMSRSVIDGMRLRGFGRIVNIGPVSVLPGAPGQRDHLAAKADILALTETLALTAAGKQVTVNAIAAGYGTEPSLAPDSCTAPEEWQAGTPVADNPVARAGTAHDITRAVAESVPMVDRLHRRVESVDELLDLRVDVAHLRIRHVVRLLEAIQVRAHVLVDHLAHLAKLELIRLHRVLVRREVVEENPNDFGKLLDRRQCAVRHDLRHLVERRRVVDVVEECRRLIGGR